MKTVSIVAAALIALPALTPVARAQGGGRPLQPKTNLEMLQSLIAEGTAGILDTLKLPVPSSIVVACSGSDECWVTEQAMQQAIGQKGDVAFVDSSKQWKESARLPVKLDVLPALAVRYDRRVGDGVERQCTASLTYRAVDPASGEVLAAGTCVRTRVDTVDADKLSSLENSSVHATQARMPEGSFFERIAEPAAIIGAVGTIIYLLFHVRS